jgi:hypothetical protein
MGEVLLPVANEIPDITDDGYVFDRIQRTIATLPVKTAITRSADTSDSSSVSVSTLGGVAGPRPEGRPLTAEEAAVVQRRIRALNASAIEIATEVDEVVASLKSQLKDYDYQVDISNKPVVKKAVKKLFRRSLKYIDKEMYLWAVERFNEIQKQKLKKEVDI